MTMIMTEQGCVLLVDKPEGITSYDVIRRLKKEYPREKIGHAGTLDPRASGLLLIGIGKGTKKLHNLVGLDKEYIADVLLGARTDTGDLDGQVVEHAEVERIERSKVEEVLTAGMVGTLTLPVSAYSAIKQGGEPLYKKARRGEKVTPPMRAMEVKEAELIEVRLQPKLKSDFNLRGVIVRVRFVVGSGTYIRSLAEELGRRLAPTPFRLLFLQNKKANLSLARNIFHCICALYKGDASITRKVWGLGMPATLAELRRTKIGPHRVEDAKRI